MVTGGASLLVDRWEPRRVARLLAETRIEQMILVPSHLSELIAAVRDDGIQVPRLGEITIGGTAISSDLVTETADVLGLPVLGQWGMTEGGLILTSRDDPPDWAAYSIGRPGVGTEAELRPAAPDAPVSEESPGRLMIRGASLCLGTAEGDFGTFRMLTDDEGWYDTGDLAIPDGRDGYRVVGRASDRIGLTMIPVAEVEKALARSSRHHRCRHRRAPEQPRRLRCVGESGPDQSARRARLLVRSRNDRVVLAYPSGAGQGVAEKPHGQSGKSTPACLAHPTGPAINARRTRINAVRLGSSTTTCEFPAEAACRQASRAEADRLER